MSFTSNKWYNKFVSDNGKGLSDYTTDLYKKIVVCKTTPYGRKFTYFDTYIDFYKHYIKVEDKTYHEIILGRYCQKAHFDIDISLKENPEIDHQEIFDKTIKAILEVYEEKFNVNLKLGKDFLIFTSHGSEKKSYHIIIDNYCHITNDECKEVYNLVYEKYKTKYLDSAVYNSLQNFRILWSHKDGSDRTKVFNERFVFQNKEYYHHIDTEEKLKNLELLKKSLVSETSDCIILPNLIKKQNNFIQENLNYDLDSVKTILDSFDNNHSILKTENNLIVLKHERSYFCKVCNVIHDSENPYLTINASGDIYFHCRRSGGKIIIGKTSIPDSNPSVSSKKFKLPEYIYSKSKYMDIDTISKYKLFNKTDIPKNNILTSIKFKI